MYFPVPALRSSTLYNGSLFLIFPHSNSSTSSPSPSPLGIGLTRTVLPRVHVAGGVRFDASLPLNDDVEDYQVIFEHCVTRTLPPALTLDDGLQKLKEALEMLKLAPPSCSSGFLRFQVSLPIHV
ncbi:protein PHYLLO chloroplastic-like [Trifolium pratense]|uniref:Protein PHYLLO chloroplastic-like n=1 Tax=Trifolium pratense TaxID=57577 RepID=A0A2K3KB51_TRIPR|nr:protein PHYLLO chloroplastic-like [Trifolium pratense]